MDPLVSILIPCYNAAPWLPATLESALAQTWSRTEIVLVDDGSTDASLRIAESYAGRGVKLFQQKKGNASAARNRAFAESRGEFIQFLDADDLLHPEKIASQLARLSEAPAGSIASGAWARFRHDPAEATFEPRPAGRDLTAIEFQRLQFTTGEMMHPAAWLCPRSVITAAGPWDEEITLNDDGEFFCRVMLASTGIVFVPEARSYYRSQIAGSLSKSKGDRAVRSALRAIVKMTDAVIARDASPPTRQACADAFRGLLHEVYPCSADVVAEIEQRTAAYGGSARKLQLGPKAGMIASIFGWRMARRFQRLLGN